VADRYDVVIVGTGPSGLGAAFHLSDARPESAVLLIDQSHISTGGLCNDCKMNFTFPIGFPLSCWEAAAAARALDAVSAHLRPAILPR
jgi:uncharacterized protein